MRNKALAREKRQGAEIRKVCCDTVATSMTLHCLKGLVVTLNVFLESTQSQAAHCGNWFSIWFLWLSQSSLARSLSLGEAAPWERNWPELLPLGPGLAKSSNVRQIPICYSMPSHFHEEEQTLQC